ncbi:MAG TPA: glutathione S-transferase family protein [Polyangiaceae bacterium]|jgi:glutathione S-transferase
MDGAPESSDLVLFGRSSSSFTRIARIYAAELGVSYEFRVVPDLLSVDATDYGGNPALRLPSLQTAEGTWFGASSICRVLSRRAPGSRLLVWPEDLDRPLTANAQELTLVALSTEVSLIMAQLARAGSGGNIDKLRRSLENTLTWLDEQIEPVLAALASERQLSFLEVTAFCLVTHLSFRGVVPVAPYPRLCAFSERFAERAAAQETPYRFDR